jgi:hypothetical protein
VTENEHIGSSLINASTILPKPSCIFFVRTIELGDHVLLIGQIIAAYALESYFDEVYDITKFNPCLHIGKNLFTRCIKESIEPKI